MKAEYRRDLSNNYLILEAPEGFDGDSYKFHMAEQNEIPGLLSFNKSKKDGALFLHYEITSKQPLSGMYERKLLKYQDIVFLLGGINDTLEGMQKYLLNPAQLVFDPQFIFVEPEKHKILLCYLPGEQNEPSIILLAEFILKKLDHEDSQAVTIGYRFYQKASEENFSLQKTLKEILAGAVPFEDQGSKSEDKYYDRNTVGARSSGTKIPESIKFSDGMSEAADSNLGRSGKIAGGQGDSGIQEEYEVTHRERRKHTKQEKKIDELFRLIHPAVLLSALLLLAVLEIVFYFGIINLTEAGGMFFLIMSVEMLANTRWKALRKAKEKESIWAEPEDDEEYRMLQREMYGVKQQKPEERQEIEETCCLIQDSGREGMRLICISGNPDKFPDIYIGKETVYIGKIKGESDIILDSPTVSRVHARLEMKNGSCYVKDMNSKNGTFCNKERLEPQEQRKFDAGDLIAFAEIEYRAVKIQ